MGGYGSDLACMWWCGCAPCPCMAGCDWWYVAPGPSPTRHHRRRHGATSRSASRWPCWWCDWWVRQRSDVKFLFAVDQSASVGEEMLHCSRPALSSVSSTAPWAHECTSSPHPLMILPCAAACLGPSLSKPVGEERSWRARRAATSSLLYDRTGVCFRQATADPRDDPCIHRSSRTHCSSATAAMRL
jgi:hypothetical protein